MLKSNYDVELAPFDLQIYESIVPADHYLRKLKAAARKVLGDREPNTFAGRDNGRQLQSDLRD